MEWPTGGSVYNGEEVGKTPGTGKRANQVHVNVAEPASQNRNPRNRELNMLKNFTPFAVKIASGPVKNILGEVRPNNGSRNQSLGRTNTRVRDVV